jgi:hypothetical protein
MFDDFLDSFFLGLFLAIAFLIVAAPFNYLFG